LTKRFLGSVRDFRPNVAKERPRVVVELRTRAAEAARKFNEHGDGIACLVQHSWLLPSPCFAIAGPHPDRRIELPHRFHQLLCTFTHRRFCEQAVDRVQRLAAFWEHVFQISELGRIDGGRACPDCPLSHVRSRRSGVVTKIGYGLCDLVIRVDMDG
jgi:hypothetical protein